MKREFAGLIFSFLVLAAISCENTSTTTTTTAPTTTSTSIPAFLDYTWQFALPSDYVFNAEVISLNNGGNSLAELKQLPADAFWTSVFWDARPSHEPEYHACALDPDGNVVAVGVSHYVNTWPSDLIINKISPDGQQFSGWPQFFSDAGFRWNEGQNVVVDADGSITVAGYAISTSDQWHMAIWRFDARGNRQEGWPKYPLGYHSYGTGIILDTEGNIVCCGGYGPTGADYLVLVKYTPDGSLVSGWPKYYQLNGNPTFAYNLIQDADENFVVVGLTRAPGSDDDALLYKFDKEGNVLSGWPKVWNSGAGYDEYFSVSQDTSGDYCVVGRCRGATRAAGPPGTDGRLLVTRYSKEGNELQSAGWPRMYEHDVYRDNWIDVWKGFVDTAGSICAAVTCESDAHIRTVKYGLDGSMATGFPKIWDKAGFKDDTRACGVDDLNNIYVVGYSESEDGNNSDFSTFVIKYPPGTYSTARPSVVSTKGIGYASLGGFSETLDSGNAGRIAYQLSADGANWNYHDGTKWRKASTKFQTNTAAEVNSRIDTFPQDVGTGTLFIKIFLVSTGEQKVELSAVTVKYKN